MAEMRISAAGARAAAVMAFALVELGGAAAWGAPTSVVTEPPTRRLAWSTYLRAGPAPTATVLDELEHGVGVAVQGCGAQWCRVAADGLSGYVDRDALVLPAPPAANAGRTDCVVVPQADDRRPAPTRFCSSATTR